MSKPCSGYSYKSVELQLCGLRCFLRFLIQEGVHADPLLEAVPTVKARKQNRIPSVWTPENVEKLIKALTVATLLVSATTPSFYWLLGLGIRTMDIKHLKLHRP